MKALIRNGQLLAKEGDVLQSPDGFRHPDSVWRLWPDSEFASRFGSGSTAVTVIDDPVPFGHVVSGEPTFSVSNGEVHRVPTTTARSVASVRTELRQRLAAIRSEKERGAITVGSRTVDFTDREVFKLTLAHVLGLGFDNWRLANGNFVNLTSAQVSAVVAAVAGHSQSCHNREATLAGEIAAASTLSALSGIDLNSGWP